MSIPGDLEARAAVRRTWLNSAVARWHKDLAVLGVWGSGGRGADDALSDWDILVAWAGPFPDPTQDLRPWFEQFGELIECGEDSYNAPAEGRYCYALYPAPLEVLPIDWYIQPA